MQVHGSSAQTAGARRLGNTIGVQRKVLDVERSVGLETGEVAFVAQVKQRASSCTNRAPFEALAVEIDRAEVFAVTAELPSNFNGMIALAFEIELTKQVTAVFALDRALARSKKASFVLRTKYSHFRTPL